jgi:hypothetical protein
MMPDAAVDWSSLLSDLGVPGVPGVPAQKSATSSGTPSEIACVPGVPDAVAEHLGTPPEHPAPASKSLENITEHLGTPGTPDLDKGGCVKVIGLPRAQLTGLAGEWSALIGTCDEDRCPASLQQQRWREILADADTFLQRWGEQAAAFGWTEMDLFSVPPGPERWGRGGLIMALGGRPVIAITQQTATIPNQSGPPHRYQRREKYGAVMLWDDRAFDGENSSDMKPR